MENLTNTKKKKNIKTPIVIHNARETFCSGFQIQNTNAKASPQIPVIIEIEFHTFFHNK